MFTHANATNKLKFVLFMESRAEIFIFVASLIGICRLFKASFYFSILTDVNDLVMIFYFPILSP